MSSIIDKQKHALRRRFPLADAGHPLAWRRRGEAVSAATFCAHVAHVADALPARSFMLNLCEDRYAFTVGFIAALLRGQTNLLPPSRLAGICEEIITDYPDSYCLTDHLHADLKIEQVPLALPDNPPRATAFLPEIDREHIAAIAFTSGSTGKARPNSKSWGSLETGAHLAKQRFSLSRETGHTLVATVPPQHMYGLETSVLLAVVCGVTVHAGRPFFPADIRAALGEVPPPRVLVTTPVHLRACLDVGLAWPAVDFIISATAPLSSELATRIERLMQTRVLEIYGFSEAGSIASRRTLDGDRWRLYDGLRISEQGGQLFVQGGHIPEPVPMSDIVECFPDGGFRLLGRNTDIVNVAGKRASLGDLNQRLSEIKGVLDGVFFIPPGSDGPVTRLAAFVVAPRLDEQAILRALAKRIDPAFLPRPLRKVDALPRGETGKLPRQALLALFESQSSKNQDQE